VVVVGVVVVGGVTGTVVDVVVGTVAVSVVTACVSVRAGSVSVLTNVTAESSELPHPEARRAPAARNARRLVRGSSIASHRSGRLWTRH
jgi:hypothetical protein